MKLIDVRDSTRKGKKLLARFQKKDGSVVSVHFGQAGSTTFSSGATEDKKNAYLKRHAPRENWNNPVTAGALSRWILWNKRSLKASIADFKKRFNL